MTLQFKVPSIACEGCAKTITESIQKGQPDAQVVVDIVNKIVTIETSAPEEIIKQAITDVGHTIE